MSRFFAATDRQADSDGNVRLKNLLPDSDDERPIFLTGARPRTRQWRDELALFVVNPGVSPVGALHEASTDWSEFSTWDTFGLFPGVQSDEIGAFVDSLPTLTGAATVDVTSAVEKWVSDPLGLTNRGWIFVPDNGDGVEVSSSESDPADERPTLTVEFFEP